MAKFLDDNGLAYLWSKIKAAIPKSVNPNLLDNWYFVNPVNQRGKTEYTGSTIAVDRWRSYGNGGSLYVTESGVKKTNDGSTTMGFQQRIPASELVPGLTYTLSALVQLLEDESDTTNHNVAFSYGISTDSNTATKWVPKTTDLSDFNVISWTFVLPESSDGIYNFRIRSVALAPISYIIKAMKLELGDKQTLAHQDSSGNWVLNEIPNYAEQLARCQRYYVPVCTDAPPRFRASVKNANFFTFTIPVPVEMRTSPSIVGSSYFGLLTQAFVEIDASGFAFAVDGHGPGWVSVIATKNSHGYTDASLYILAANILKVAFSAEL